MNSTLKGLVFGVMFLLMSATVSQAMMVSATPSTVDVGHTVNFRIEAKEWQIRIVSEIGEGGLCQLEVNFGDNSPVVNATGRFTTNTNCLPDQNTTFTATHAYSKAGTYTVTVRSKNCGGNCTVMAPNPATTIVVVREKKNADDVQLPAGTVVMQDWGRKGGLDFPGSKQLCDGELKYDCFSGSTAPLCVKDARCGGTPKLDAHANKLCDLCEGLSDFSPQIPPQSKTCPSGYALVCQKGKDVCFKPIK